MSKNITLRLPEEEYNAFDTICDERGYSKTGKIREFIRNLIKDELRSVAISRDEWKKVAAGMREIERGEFVSLEELEREVKEEKVESK